MKKHDFVSTGIPSIFMIFTVLVLVILSLMSLGTSRIDLEESRVSYEMTLAYYEAGGQMTDVIGEARRLALEEGKDAMEGYLLGLTSPIECRFEEGTYRLELAYSDRQSLLVTLKEGTKEEPLILTGWMSVQRGEWKNESRPKLFDPSKGLSATP